jgi:hypothetical protein
MVVLYQPDRVATRSLERTGLLEDGRIIFVASSPVRSVGAHVEPLPYPCV